MQLLSTSSIPILYNYPLIIVNGEAFMARVFFLFVGWPFEDFIYSNKLTMSSKSLGAYSTLNKCASRRSSSMHVRSSPISSRDRCYTLFWSP
jgi:hypothetical protein